MNMGFKGDMLENFDVYYAIISVIFIKILIIF
jgi:hypothetical protein